MLGVLLSPLEAADQPATRVPRIGLLRLGTPPDPYLDGFRQGLRELGYEEGRNVILEYRWAEGRPERLADLAAELVAAKVDVILTGGGVAGVQAVQRATRTIPIVMPVATDPVSSGLVHSLTQPGGNVTGIALPSRELNARRLRLLKEALPRISRVAVLWNPGYRPHAPAATGIDPVARSLGVTLQPLEVRDRSDFEIAFAATSRGYADALMVLASPIRYLHLRWIADLALKHRLPAVSEFSEFAEPGGLMAMVRASRRCTGRPPRTSTRSSKAPSPRRPADRMSGSRRSLRTATGLGLTIPPEVRRGIVRSGSGIYR